MPTLQNPSLQSRLIPLVPSFSPPIVPLLLPPVCIAGWVPAELKAVLTQISTEQEPNFPLLPPLSSSYSGEAGVALGRAALC